MTSSLKGYYVAIEAEFSKQLGFWFQVMVLFFFLISRKPEFNSNFEIYFYFWKEFFLFLITNIASVNVEEHKEWYKI